MAKWKSTRPPNKKTEDISGQRFGKLTVIGFSHRLPNTRGTHLVWLCRCDCGNTVSIRGMSLKKGHTKSCGCFRREAGFNKQFKHGMTGSREWLSWTQAKQRCHTPSHHAYKWYGARGITMCNAWRDSFESFLQDMGPCPKDHEIDRIDVNGNYEPSNCKWATCREQARNKRTTIWFTHKGKTLTLKEWAERTGIPYGTLWDRMKHGRRIL